MSEPPIPLNLGINWTVLTEALNAGDLEGHLSALVLNTGFNPGSGTISCSPWETTVQALLAEDPVPAGPLRRTQDVAMVGVRLALGGAGNRVAEFTATVKRELARQPLPPVACIWDDERLLLGVAAGIGATDCGLADELAATLRTREHGCSLRQSCVNLWAEALAQGAPKIAAACAKRAIQHLMLPHSPTQSTVTEEDIISVFWLSTRLLDAPWQPTDEELSMLDIKITDGRRAVMTILATGYNITPLDAAFILDALSATPLKRLVRQTARTATLAIIDAFPTVANTLASRKRERPPFIIRDEYDVQDLFHALVLPVLLDLVEEDPVPKVAGKGSRLDFTSKATRLGFEIKHVKSPAHANEVRKEILIDERTYQEHPYIDTVVVFVSDPNNHIPLEERIAFEADLSQSVAVAGRTIQYITRVR